MRVWRALRFRFGRESVAVWLRPGGNICSVPNSPSMPNTNAYSIPSSTLALAQHPGRSPSVQKGVT
eukprot:784528-Lingulodinium_polyedra.AAC.1